MKNLFFKIILFSLGLFLFGQYSYSQGMSGQPPGSYAHCEDQCVSQHKLCRQQARAAERSGGGSQEAQCYNQTRNCQSKCGILKEGNFGEHPEMEPCEKSIHKSRPYLARIKDGLEEEGPAPRRSSTISK